MQMEKLSGTMLKKLGNESETAKNVCLALATRERIRDFSNINALKYELRHQGFKIVEADYMKMWKDWQAAGLGVILLGKGKKQTKFIHYYDMRKIASAALEGKDVEVAVRHKQQQEVIKEANATQINRIAKSIGEAIKQPILQDTIKKLEVVAPKPLSKAPSFQSDRVFISLRPDVFVDLSLPKDITAAEIERIKAVLNEISRKQAVA